MLLNNNALSLLEFAHSAFKKRSTQMSLDYLLILIAIKNGANTRELIALFVGRSTPLGVKLALDQLAEDKLIKNKIIKNPDTGRSVTEYALTLKAERVQHIFEDPAILVFCDCVRRFLCINKARPLLKHLVVILNFARIPLQTKKDFRAYWANSAQEADDALRLFRKLNVLTDSKLDDDGRVVLLTLTELGVQLIPEGLRL